MHKQISDMVGVPPEKRRAFSCARYDKPVSTSEIEGLIALTTREIGGHSKFSQASLEGVIGFLKNHTHNAFEGRVVEEGSKSSFADSEIATALSFPEERRVEYLVYRLRFATYTAQKVVGDFPTIVAVELTSLCNIRCTMCFQADDQYFVRANPHMGYMDIGLYRTLIDEMAENQPCGLVLASRGEPTLHPKFTEMVAYATARGIIDVKLNTNATALTEARSRELLAAEPTTVVFSVDAGNKEEFEAIRIGASFDRVVANIKRFNEIREKEFPGSRTRTRISMTLFRDTQSPEEAEKFWSPLVDEFAIHSANYRLDIYDHPPLPNITHPCNLLWERVYVWWNGEVNPCDMDYKSHLSFGRVGDGQTIKSVWLGQKMQLMRDSHANGGKNNYFPCNQCYGS